MPNVNGAVTKDAVELGHVEVITESSVYLLIHALI